MADRCLLAVFAHPDDETFRPGGTLALLARAGVRVHLLTLTRGEAGSCGEPPLCTPQELPAVRERELLLARDMGSGAYANLLQAGLRLSLTAIADIDEAALQAANGTIMHHQERLH